jgi:Protein of unknown function (DUF3352)
MSMPNNPQFPSPQQGNGYQNVPPSQQHGPATRSNGSKKGLIAGVTVGALVLLGAGAAVAYNSMMSPSGDHPSSVLPANAAMYMELDLDPSADQKKAFMALEDKFPDLASEEGQEMNLKESVTSNLSDNYAQDIEPWIGDRLGAAVVSGSSSESEPDVYLAYQIKDKEAAESSSASFDVDSVIVGEYLIISADDTTPVPAEGFSDVLSDVDNFSKDLDTFGKDNILTMWGDMAKLQELGNASGIVDQYAGMAGVGPEVTEQAALTGRGIIGVHLDENAVEVKGRTIDFKVDGKSTDVKSSKGNVAEDLGNLPDGSSVAVSIGGLDEILKQIVTENPEIATELENMNLDALGIDIPEGMTDLIGSTTSVGLDVSDDSNMPIQALLRDADQTILSNIFRGMGAMDYGVEISEDNGLVTISSGDVTAGKLSDDPMFKEALPELKDAHMAAYVDIDQLVTEMGEGSADEYYGVMGMTATTDGGDGETLLRWVFSD